MITLHQLCEALCTKCNNEPEAINFVLSYGNDDQKTKALACNERLLSSGYGDIKNVARVASVVASHSMFSDQKTTAKKDKPKPAKNDDKPKKGRPRKKV